MPVICVRVRELHTHTRTHAMTDTRTRSHALAHTHTHTYNDRHRHHPPPIPHPHQRTCAHTNTRTFRVTELQQINQLRERAETEVAKGVRVATPNMRERDQVHNQCTQTRTGGFGLPHEPSLSVRRGCFETLSITHTLNALICRSRETNTNTLTHTLRSHMPCGPVTGGWKYDHRVLVLPCSCRRTETAAV